MSLLHPASSHPQFRTVSDSQDSLASTSRSPWLSSRFHPSFRYHFPSPYIPYFSNFQTRQDFLPHRPCMCHFCYLGCSSSPPQFGATLSIVQVQTPRGGCSPFGSHVKLGTSSRVFSHGPCLITGPSTCSFILLWECKGPSLCLHNPAEGDNSVPVTSGCYNKTT